MANKQNFKPDEWTKILESTMLAGMAGSAAAGHSPDAALAQRGGGAAR